MPAESPAQVHVAQTFIITAVLSAFMFLCMFWLLNCRGIEALNIEFITPIHICVNKGFIYLTIYL
jgi:predicted secreted protein